MDAFKLRDSIIHEYKRYVTIRIDDVPEIRAGHSIFTCRKYC